MVEMNQESTTSTTIICPTCMVHLPSVTKLSEHWKRFHSQNALLEKQNRRSNSASESSDHIVSTEGLDWRIFHEFTDSKIVGPTNCDYCQEILYSDAKQCEACGFTCHSECEQMVVTLCDRPSAGPSTVGESTKESSVHIPRQVLAQAVNNQNGLQAQLSPGMSSIKKNMVAEKKGDELDLIYVTDRLVVMSFPANGMESIYRQKLSNASVALKEKHKENYMIFNVSERRYDLSKINNQVLDFGWPDHLAPPLERLLSIIKSIDSWTSAKTDNVAVIHCKGGKGRIGVVISAYIQFSKLCPSPQAALDWFALKGYLDNKLGVQLHPSQQRYVFYIGEMLERRLKICKRPIVLRDLILHGIPEIETGGGCHPFFRVYQGLKLVATSDTYIASADMERVCVRFDKGINLDGDVMIKCGQKGKRESSSDVIFRCQFHTDAVKDYGLVFDKSELDEACQDERFPSTCQIEFIFGPTAKDDEHPGSPEFEASSHPYELLLKDPNHCVSDMIDGKTLDGGFKSMDINMARSHQADFYSGPHHIPGPLNGNPYAQIDPIMKATLRHRPPGIPVNHKAPYEIDKGIVMNGHVPSGIGKANGDVSHGLLTTADFDYHCDKDDRGSPRLDSISGGDSAYGESMKSASPLSSPICEQPPRMDSIDKTTNGFGSHSSSLTSIEDGYARIEDLKRPAKKSPIDEEVITVTEVADKVESAMLFDMLDEDPPTIKRSPFPHSTGKAMSPRMEMKSAYSPEHRLGSPKFSARTSSVSAGSSPLPRPRLASSPRLGSSPRQADKLNHVYGSRSPRLLPKANHSSGSILSGRCPDHLHYSRSQSNGSISSDGSESIQTCPGCQWVEQSCHSSHSSSLNDASMPEHTLPRRGRRRSKKSVDDQALANPAEFFREVLRYPNIKFDKDTLDCWYKPKITREEATMLLRGKEPGTFVVRDSQSYEGAFGLAVKVSTPPLGIIQQAGGDLSKIDLNNELIRHFLIEPCRQGVRLKGNNNEPVFPSLVALIYQHSLTKLALPVLLVVPNEDLVLTDSVDGDSEADLTVEQILFEKGAACNLIYLGVVDVEGLTGDGAVQYSVGKLLVTATSKTADLTIINIKVNAQGITMTDNERKLFFRRHYPMGSVLHTGIDPKDRRVNLKDLVPDSSYQAACFGIVSRKPGKRLENECHVFGELDHDQPASAIISFIQKAMRYPKGLQ